MKKRQRREKFLTGCLGPDCFTGACCLFYCLLVPCDCGRVVLDLELPFFEGKPRVAGGGEARLCLTG